MKVVTYAQGKGKKRARYRCEVKPVTGPMTGGSMTLLSRLLGRIGIRVGSVFPSVDGGWFAVAITSFGERVFAEFRANEARLARLFVYRESLESSPQLSLWGFVV